MLPGTAYVEKESISQRVVTELPEDCPGPLSVVEDFTGIIISRPLEDEEGRKADADNEPATTFLDTITLENLGICVSSPVYSRIRVK